MTVWTSDGDSDRRLIGADDWAGMLILFNWFFKSSPKNKVFLLLFDMILYVFAPFVGLLMIKSAKYACEVACFVKFIV